MEEKNIIDHETAKRIAEYYQAQSSKIDVATIICTIASLFVGIGIICIIAFNWDSFPPTARLLIGLVPLAASTAGCCYALKWKAGNRAWSECTAVLQALSFAANFAIVNQTYQVQLSFESFLCTVILLSIPFVFIMRSATLALLITLCTYAEFWEDHTTILLTSPIIALTEAIVVVADVAFLYHYYIRRNEGFLLRLRCALLPAFIVVFSLKTQLAFSLTDSDGELLHLLLLLSSILYAIHTWINESRKITSRGLVSKLGFYLLFFPCALAICLSSRDSGSFNIGNVVATLAIILSLFLKWRKKRRIQWQEWIAIPAWLLSALPFKGALAIEGFTFVVILFTIYESSKECDLMKLNFGLLALFAWPFCSLKSFPMGSHAFGFTLVLMGIALLFMNSLFIKKRKKHEHNENK